jgi:hypothetical protein
MGDAFLRMKLKDQAKALAMITADGNLAGLRQIRAPLVDYEVRGLPALQYFGGMVWRDAIEDYGRGGLPNLPNQAHCRQRSNNSALLMKFGEAKAGASEQEMPQTVCAWALAVFHYQLCNLPGCQAPVLASI